MFYEFDLVMTASDPTHVALSFPAASSADFYMSGYGEGQEELGGTAAVIDKPRNTGRVILFSTDPNFRAWTEGMQRVLRNAVLGPEATAATAAGTAAERETARVAAEALLTLESPIRLSVEQADAEQATELVERYTTNYVVRRSRGQATFVLANPRGLSAEEHPFAVQLAGDVAESGMEVIAFSMP